ACYRYLFPTACYRYLFIIAYRRLTVQRIMGDSKLSPYQSGGKPPYSKERSGQAQGLPLPWLPSLGFYAVLRQTLGKQTSTLYCAGSLGKY
ncbi:MAG: hypothetical protein ACUVTH_13710, partial [Thermogutta sp.]